MFLWIFITFALVLQETTTETAALMAASTLWKGFWIAHVIFLVATIFDVFIGFKLGKWIQGRFAQSRMNVWMRTGSKRFERLAGAHGTRFALATVGFLTFPYVAAFLSSYLDIPLATTMVYTVMGNTLSYIAIWLIALGALNYLKDYVSLITFFAVLITLGILGQKYRKKHGL